MRLPGDDLVARPRLRTDHAITIDAPPGEVWPWLTQLGWHLGGYYTPAWVDRLLFRQNWPSLDHLDPALLRDLKVGDTIPDGPPGTAWYVVAEVEAPHILVLHSTTHLPPGWRERFGAEIDWTWSMRLTELPGRRTRLQLRVRGRMAPPWVTATYLATIVPAEARRPQRSSGRPPAGGIADRLITPVRGETCLVREAGIRLEGHSRVAHVMIRPSRAGPPQDQSGDQRQRGGQAERPSVQA
jgi:hypothetical protein